ncbi:MAG: pentapeptide repeat-containing protein [Prochlorothrix sp.]|nr:pentapeptide repeat-containing protein [Prochlorothrix sp.]
MTSSSVSAPTARRRPTPAQAAEILTAYRNGTRNFQNYDLRNQDFSKANLAQSDFSGCWFQGTNFQGANLEGVNFSYVKTGLTERSQWILGILLALGAILAVFLIYGLGTIVYCGIELNLLGLMGGNLALGLLGWSLGAAVIHFLTCNFLGDDGEGFLGLALGLGAVLLVLTQQPLAMAFVGLGVAIGLGRSIHLLWRANPLAPAVLALVAVVAIAAFFYQAHAFGFDPSQTLAPALGASAVLIPLLVLYGQASTLQFHHLTQWEPGSSLLASAIVSLGGASAVAVGLVMAGDVLELFPSMVMVATASFLGLILGLSLGWRDLQAEAQGQPTGWINRWAIATGLAWGTQFQNATLTEAIFQGATLRRINWQGAILDHCRWHRVRSLSSSDYGQTYLRYGVIRRLFIGILGQEERNFEGCHLWRVNLSFGPDRSNALDLTGASFVGADLREANLQYINLTNAQLLQTKLQGACLTGVCLTGACIEGWVLNTATQTDSIRCDYLYLRRPTAQDPDPWRQPANPDQFLTPAEQIVLLQPAPAPIANLAQEFAAILQWSDPLRREYELMERSEAAARQGISPDRYRVLFQAYAQAQTSGEGTAPERWRTLGRSGGRSAQNRTEAGWNQGIAGLLLNGEPRSAMPWLTLPPLLRWGLVGLGLVVLNSLLQPDLSQQYRPWEVMGAEGGVVQGGSRIALEHLHRTGTDLSNLQAPAAELPNIRLPGAKLQRANLAEANLAGADLSRADLYRATLERANLVNAKLGYSQLTGMGQGTIVAALEARLHGYWPPLWQRGADLREAKLKDADLTGADLRDANLEGADLRNVVFTAALLQGANFAGTDLRSAYLNATLSQVNFSNALYSYLTIFPAGFDPEAAGMVLEEALDGDVDPSSPELGEEQI